MSSATAPQMRVRCKWCGEIELLPGQYECGTVGKTRGPRCYVACGETVPRSAKPRQSRRKPREEWSPNGRRKSEERLAIEAMQVGETRVFAVGREKVVRFAQCLVARRNDGTSLVVRNANGKLVANLVPDIADMQVGEARRYTDDFSLIARLVLNRNTRYLRGKEERMFTFDLLDGAYWLRRLA